MLTAMACIDLTRADEALGAEGDPSVVRTQAIETVPNGPMARVSTTVPAPASPATWNCRPHRRGDRRSVVRDEHAALRQASKGEENRLTFKSP